MIPDSPPSFFFRIPKILRRMREIGSEAWWTEISLFEKKVPVSGLLTFAKGPIAYFAGLRLEGMRMKS